MTYIHAKSRSEVSWFKTGGRTDMTDCSTFPANAVGHNYFCTAVGNGMKSNEPFFSGLCIYLYATYAAAAAAAATVADSIQCINMRPKSVDGGCESKRIRRPDASTACTHGTEIRPLRTSAPPA